MMKDLQTTDGLESPSLEDRCKGVLLGTAVGDALGLPAEGLSPRRAKKLLGSGWRHRFLPGWGMVSDDTEHSLFVVQCLLYAPTDLKRFTRRFAWCLRGWLVSLPAGIGLATGRAIIRLWLGFPAHRAGVFSAGNGPAMRAAPIGAFFGARAAQDSKAHLDPNLNAYLEASTRLTHTDPRALIGARAIAYIAAWSVHEVHLKRPALDSFLALLGDAGTGITEADGLKEWREIVAVLGESLRGDHSVAEYAKTLGQERGIGGYIFHTVPVVLYAWYRHFGDFKTTLEAVLDLGGDADTTGAIVGGVAGAVCGAGAIPYAWLAGIKEWPRTISVLEEAAQRLAKVAQDGVPAKPVAYFWPGLVLRNPLFFIVVLLHGFRRLLPPY